MLNYPVIYSLSKRLAVNMQGTVFTLARLKIFHNYHQELVSHHCQIILKPSLVTKYLQQPFPDSYWPCRSRVYPFSSIWTPNLQLYSSLINLTTAMVYFPGRPFPIESVKSSVHSRVMNVRHVYT